MKLRNFTKFFTGIALISVLSVGVVISNHTHSSLVVENKVTSDISWSIDDKGNIEPTDESKVSGEITIHNTVDGKVVTGIAKGDNLSDNKVAESLAYGKIDIELRSGKISITNSVFFWFFINKY